MGPGARRSRTCDLSRRGADLQPNRALPVIAVVLLENGLQTVGEGVGGADAEVREATSQAEFRRKERRDRTQEVAGSSPASSTRLLPRLAIACLVTGIGFTTIADAAWAHTIGVLCFSSPSS